jgi:hypothetical protein
MKFLFDLGKEPIKIAVILKQVYGEAVLKARVSG